MSIPSSLREMGLRGAKGVRGVSSVRDERGERDERDERMKGVREWVNKSTKHENKQKRRIETETILT